MGRGPRVAAAGIGRSSVNAERWTQVKTVVAGALELSPAERASFVERACASDQDLRAFAAENGWRIVRRVGGRQIEFYNDASQRVQQPQDNEGLSA